MIGNESLWGRLFRKPAPFLLPSERAPSVDTYLAGFRAGISTVVKAAGTCEDSDAKSRVIKALAEAGGSVGSNDELAELLGDRKGTVSKWVSALEAAGKVRRHRDGRQVQIKLVA